MIKVSQIKRGLLFLSKRCFWFYFVMAAILIFYVQQPAPFSVKVCRLNYLRQSENTISKLISKKQQISRREYFYAIKYYKELIEFIGSRDYIFGNMGFCWYYIGHYDKALKMYDEAIRLNPKIYTYYADKAMIYCTLGQYQAAMPLLQQSLVRALQSVEYYKSYFEIFPDPWKTYAKENSNILVGEINRDLLFLSQTLAVLELIKDGEKLSNAKFNPEDMSLHLDIFLGSISTDIAVLRKFHDSQ